MAPFNSSIEEAYSSPEITVLVNTEINHFAMAPMILLIGLRVTNVNLIKLAEGRSIFSGFVIVNILGRTSAKRTIKTLKIIDPYNTAACPNISIHIAVANDTASEFVMVLQVRIVLITSSISFCNLHMMLARSSPSFASLCILGLENAVIAVSQAAKKAEVTSRARTVNKYRISKNTVVYCFSCESTCSSASASAIFLLFLWPGQFVIYPTLFSIFGLS